MKLRIKKKKLKVLQAALLKAGTNEIGGVLFGEHVGDEDFRVSEMIFQRRSGDEVTFRRTPKEAMRSLKKLNMAYGYNYARFNYLGEWHSHPNAPVIPSQRDCITMQELLTDPATDANFLILLIVRRNATGDLELSANAFLASGHVLTCDVEIEIEIEEPTQDKTS